MRFPELGTCYMNLLRVLIVSLGKLCLLGLVSAYDTQLRSALIMKYVINDFLFNSLQQEIYQTFGTPFLIRITDV